MSAKTALVADIGGTNARFAIATMEEGKIDLRDRQRFLAEDFETVRDAADAYLESVSERPQHACFAAAGPIIDGNVAFTNSHWQLSHRELVDALQLKSFRIVNDFYGLSAGVDYLPAEAFLEVKSGTPMTNTPRLVIGPGTGLGQALIVPTPVGSQIVSTEGGHVSYAPRTDEEFEIQKFIMQEHPRVSVERLLSGRGLVNIHRALCAIADTPRVSLQANEITQAAIDGTYPIAVKAVDTFCGLLGRVVGDAVLATGARGGVVLGGGILPKIRDVFMKSDFVDRFLEKGRMRSYVETVPVNLIVDGEPALYGAAASVVAE